LCLSHCGFGDRDGTLILNALVDAASSKCGPSSSNSGSCSSSSGGGRGYAADRDWVLLDLAYNAFEGGAALCAATLVTAEAAAAAAAAAAGGGSASVSSSGAGLNASFSDAWGAGSSKAQQQLLPRKWLVLDGNPLGASGVRMLMRAIAAQPAVGIGAADAHLACCFGGGTAASCDTSSSAAAAGDSSRSGAFYETTQQGGAAAQQQHLHVSVAKVSLLAKEKGFRASMRAAEAAQAFAAPVSPLDNVVCNMLCLSSPCLKL
jgi:hypothetical protein